MPRRPSNEPTNEEISPLRRRRTNADREREAAAEILARNERETVEAQAPLRIRMFEESLLAEPALSRDQLSWEDANRPYYTFAGNTLNFADPVEAREQEQRRLCDCASCRRNYPTQPRAAIVYDENGYDEYGYDRLGFNADGFSRYGFDREGYSRLGFDREGYNRRGFDVDGVERPCDCADCLAGRGRDVYNDTWFDPRQFDAYEPRQILSTDDYEDDDDFEYLNQPREVLLNYSYRPSTLNFRRSHGEVQGTVPFYGMEIEMTSRLSDLELALIRARGRDGGLLYAKTDGSVRGFEMVSHPMTMQWAVENFPWAVVDELIAAGASVITESNGLHIHVSRSGFKDEAHTYRWLKFWYRNSQEIVRIAGRSGAEWGRFSADAASLHGRHLKARAKARHNGSREGDDESYRAAGARYNALNLQNPHTIEARIFASPRSSEDLKTKFQFMAASVEYTRSLDVKKIRAGAWAWDSFTRWVADYAFVYPQLAAAEAGTSLRLR